MPGFDTVSGNITSGSGAVTSNPMSGVANGARVSISGSYTGFQGKIQGSADGTNFFDLLCIREDTYAAETYPLSPADNATRAWLVSSNMLEKIRLQASALASGTVVVRIDTGGVHPPPVQATKSL